MVGSPRPVPRVIALIDRHGHGDVAANLAVLLSLADRRVLIVDVAAKITPVTRHLRQITNVDFSGHPDVEPAITLLRRETTWRSALRRPRLSRYLLPTGSAPLDVFTAELDEPARLDEVVPLVRSVLHGVSYDYIVIRTAGDRVTQAVADALLICFPANDAAAARAGASAAEIRRDRPDATVVPVVVGPQAGGSAATAFARAFASALPTPVDAAANEIQVIALPAAPGGDDVVAVLLMKTLPPGYTQLARAASHDGATTVPPAPERVRELYRRRQTQHGAAERVWLAAATADRPWREWISSVLERAGLVPVLLPAGLDRPAPSLVLIGAEEGLEPDVRDAFHTAAAVPGTRVIQIRHRLDILSPSVPDASWVDATVADRWAVARIRAELMVPATAAVQTAGRRPRFPARVHDEQRLVNLRSPSRGFVGRGRELDALRDGLLRRRLAVVTGPMGSGKRQLVNEYGNRFSSDYDVIWWVPAHDRTAAQDSLEALGSRLRTLPEPVTDSAALALGRDEPSDRWLLIFHDADNLAVVRDLLPTSGSGHVILTSRAPDEAELARLHIDGAARVPLDVLSPRDGVALFTRRVQLLPERDAEQIAHRLGLVPLANHLAAAAIREDVSAQHPGGAERADNPATAGRRYLAALDEVPDDQPVRAALRISLRRLSQAGAIGQLAVRLGRMLCFLSADGISLDLMSGSAMQAELASLADPADAARLRSDRFSFEGVMRLGARYGIFEVEWDVPLIRMHRVVQDFFKDLMSPEEAAAARTAAQLGLARSAPNELEIETNAHRQERAELHKHIEATEAADAADREVRGWLSRQLHYVAQFGNREQRDSARALAQRLIHAWSTDGRDEDLRLRIECYHARLCHELGDWAEASAALARALERMRDLLGPDHPRTLLMGRPAGWYSQALGRFQAAQLQDIAVYEGLRRVLGADNPNTLYAANNLAISSYLMGDLRDAIQLEERVLHRWLEQTGWDGPQPWRVGACLGLFLREAGHYSRAHTFLQRSRDASGRHPQRADAAILHLHIDCHMAGIRRLTGQPARAAREHREALRRYEELTDPHNPGRLSCEMALAADEFEARKPELALDRARRVLDRYRTAFPERHPYRLVAQVNLGGFLLGAGQPDQARAVTEDAWQALAQALGARHPWTFAAAINWSAALNAVGDDTAPGSDVDRLAADCVSYLTDSHPYAQVALANRHKERALGLVFIDVPVF